MTVRLHGERAIPGSGTEASDVRRLGPIDETRSSPVVPFLPVNKPFATDHQLTSKQQ